MELDQSKKETVSTLGQRTHDNVEFKCKICLRAKANYTCPKCLAPYCSLECYQAPKHENCSEKFYEKNVLEELQNRSANDDEKKMMVDMLRQFEEDCGADEQELLHEEERAQLAARMEGIDLDGDPQKIWAKLTPKERNSFTNILKENRLSELVQEWLPWWTYKKKREPLVQDVDESHQNETDLSEFQFPDIITTIQPFSTFTKASPNPCLRFNTLNILQSYVYMVTRYNGEHLSMPVQCAEDLVSLSAVLVKAENFNSCSESIRANHSSCKQLDDLYISLEYFNETVNSTVLIIHGPYEQPSNDYLLMAFSDMLTLIGHATKELRKEVDFKEARKKLMTIKKKLEFYSSYVLTHGVEEMVHLVPDIILSAAALKEDHKLLKKSTTEKFGKPKPTNKIEVIGS